MRRAVEIEASGVQHKASLNQRKDPVWLGPFRLSGAVMVTIRNADADGYVVVDGLQIVPAGR